jgi:TPR repeat
MRFWRNIFGRHASPGHETATASPPLTGGSPRIACLACRRTFDAPLATCPTCGSYQAIPEEPPQWFAALQAHVTALQSNQRAVQLFRQGRLTDAIAELRRGVEANPQYATGYSNLGFLYLRKGQLDRAVRCLLRALEVDPYHQDAPDHLVDVLSALTDELVQIGFRDGFLSTQPGGTFDDRNRHTRARAIGALIAEIGQRGIFKVDGHMLATPVLMAIVVNMVQRKMGHHRRSTTLKFVWDGICGWRSCRELSCAPPFGYDRPDRPWQAQRWRR